MAYMFTISDSESKTSAEVGDTDQSGAKQGAMTSQLGHALTVPDRLSEGGRLRMYSESQTSSLNEEELQDWGAGEEAGESTPFRIRSHSAPPALWAAKKYGQQLRRMSDEFDTLMDKGMKRVRSAGAARPMHPSPSWFAFLWSHKETDAEMSSSLTSTDSRPAE